MKVLDLFCGAAGGWTLGLHRAGWTTVAACEVDPWRRAVFSHNWPEVVMFDDVRTLTANALAGLGTIDAIVGSPPCQDASTANAKGRGVDGERTGLFFEAVRLVREVRPRWVCLENVPGLRARGYDRVHDALEAAGYAVRPLVVGAWHAGAPHRRNRVWIIANLPAVAGSQGGWRLGSGWRIEQSEAGAPGRDDADADGYWGPSGREGCAQRIEPRAEQVAGLGAVRSAEGRGWEAAWDHWNGGAPDLGRVDDGLSARLASRRGIGRACLAAYGDAVLPQITEMIGRAILAADFELAARRGAPAACRLSVCPPQLPSVADAAGGDFSRDA